MKDRPKSHADLPFSCSAGVNRFLRTKVATDSAMGGTMPAAMTVAMIFRDASSPVDSPAVANRYAALLTGPPRSKHIIKPRMMPSTMAEEPDIPFSPSCMAVMSASSGRPSNRYMDRPTTRDVSSGIITTGINEPIMRGTFHEPIHMATRPAMMPVIRPPMKPAPTVTEIAPPTKPGAIPGRPANAYAM